METHTFFIMCFLGNNVAESVGSCLRSNSTFPSGSFMALWGDGKALIQEHNDFLCDDSYKGGWYLLVLLCRHMPIAVTEMVPSHGHMWYKRALPSAISI